jgi:alpha-L-fucosidase
MSNNRFMKTLSNIILAIGFAVMSANAGPNPVPSTNLPTATGVFEPTWQSMAANYRVPEWFRDAKFGIWSHWGPQAVPGEGDWYARNMYLPKNPNYQFHTTNYGHPSQFGYKDILPLFKAEKFDADAQMKLFKRAGAKYFFALANHHDNYDCFDSAYQPWNSVNIGPKKDLVGLWAKAAQQENIRLGISIHNARSWYWWEPAHKSDTTGPLKDVPYDGSLTLADGKGKWWEGYDPQQLYCAPYKAGDKETPAYIQNWVNRTKELINKYHPDVLYFDDQHTRFERFGKPGMEVLSHFYNANQQWHGGQLEAVAQVKSLVPNVTNQPYLLDCERWIQTNIYSAPWQNDTAIGDWFPRRGEVFKTPEQIIQLLVDVVSKNGNLMLAVPQQGDGSLKPEAIHILDKLGDWFAVNAEAIYGTRPWVKFGEGPSQWSGSESEKRGGKREPFTPQDFRFTTKGDTLYAFAFVWPKDGQLLIKSLASGSSDCPGTIGEVRLLGYDGKVKWERSADGLKIQLTGQQPSPSAFVFKILPAK